MIWMLATNKHIEDIINRVTVKGNHQHSHDITVYRDKRLNKIKIHLHIMISTLFYTSSTVIHIQNINIKCHLIAKHLMFIKEEHFMIYHMTILNPINDCCITNVTKIYILCNLKTSHLASTISCMRQVLSSKKIFRVTIHYLISKEQICSCAWKWFFIYLFTWQEYSSLYCIQYEKRYSIKTEHCKRKIVIIYKVRRKEGMYSSKSPTSFFMTKLVSSLKNNSRDKIHKTRHMTDKKWKLPTNS